MSDQYLGEIRLFSGNYAPQGWALCNGQVLPVSQNEALFTLLGKTYGGNGQTTFALPDLQGRFAVHMGKSTAGTSYTIGEQGGSETVTITSAQLPTHTHTVSAQQLAGVSNSPTNNIWATSPFNMYSNLASNNNMDPAVISSVGGNESHDNMMPFLTLTYIIALQGIFPTHS